MVFLSLQNAWLFVIAKGMSVNSRIVVKKTTRGRSDRKAIRKIIYKYILEKISQYNPGANLSSKAEIIYSTLSI
jgi:hypothetical protein